MGKSFEEPSKQKVEQELAEVRVFRNYLRQFLDVEPNQHHRFVLSYNPSGLIRVFVSKELVNSITENCYRENRNYEFEYSYQPNDVEVYNHLRDGLITRFLGQTEENTWLCIFSRGFEIDMMDFFSLSKNDLLKRYSKIDELVMTTLNRWIRNYFKVSSPNYHLVMDKNLDYNVIISFTFFKTLMNIFYSSIHSCIWRLSSQQSYKKYLQEVKRIRESETMINNVSGGFLERIFGRNNNQFHHKRNDFQFVVSNTKNLENYEFGKLGERSLYNYLIKLIPDSKSILSLFGYNKSEYLETSYEMVWNNKDRESGLPYDIEFQFRVSYESYFTSNLFIEVKTTRFNEETVFYFSLPEVEFMMNNYTNYIIGRVSFLDTPGSYNGIRIHDEFYVNFYIPTEEIVTTIRENLVEWKEHYKTDKVRFTIDHFKLIGGKDDVELPF